MTITRDAILDWLRACAAVIGENQERLTELDAETGDADHGTNMQRGFQAVLSKLPGVQDKDIGTICKTVGMALVSTVGGAAGPLYGTFFLRMGGPAAGKDALSADDLLAMWSAGVQGVRERGKASPGEKTMVDALQPAVDVLREGLGRGLDLASALQAAADAAESGMRATIPLKALKGRASYLGERSIGHQDPGATSSCLIVQALRDALARRAA